jgi:hypothetical protein
MAKTKMIYIRTCSVLRLLHTRICACECTGAGFVPLSPSPFLVPEDTGLSLLAHAAGRASGPGLRPELVTHLHQRETEQVKTRPLFWCSGSFVISGEPDTPDPIPRGSLDQHPIAGTEQELAQVRMMAEFRQIPGDDQLEATLRPDFLAEAAHLPAQ